MKSTKNLVAAVALVWVLTLCGCAMLDGLFLKPAKTPSGELAFRDVKASDAAGKDVIVPASERVPGREYEQVFTDQSTGVAEIAGGVLGLIPGWGQLAAGATSLFAGIYLAIRGRKKLSMATLKGSAMEMGLQFAASVVADFVSGKIDADKDGKVSIDEIKRYVAERAKDALKPEFVTEIIRIFTSSMEPAERQKAVEAAVFELY